MKNQITLSVIAVLFAVEAIAQQGANYLTKFSTPPSLVNSLLFDNGTGLAIGTTNTNGHKLRIVGGTISLDNNQAIYMNDGLGNDINALWVDNTGLTNINASYLNGNGAIRFRVGGGDRMRILYNGNIGINTTNPLAKLQVQNGSVLFNGISGNTPISGLGVRMMWVPDKMAFRAGQVSGNQWDDTNIGLFSFATGNDPKANGVMSFAAGGSTTASGWASFAVGNSTTASGKYSSSFGNNTLGQSYSSFVIGSYNYDPGTYNTTSWITTDALFVIGNGTGSSARSNAVTVLKNGNTGLGTYNPQYKLEVKGTIKACEIRANLTGCDFVFENDYKLMPLKELDEYVRQNKHLPGIAPAKEMETIHGVSLGELNSQLLQKIEELTLYIVDLNKRINHLEEKK